MKKIFLVFLIIYCTGCSSITHSSRGWEHYKNSNYEQALLEFQTANKTSDKSGIYLGLYRTYMRMNNETQAIIALEKGLQKNPDDGFLNWSMSDYLSEKKNDPCGALKYLQKVKQSRLGRGSLSRKIDAEIIANSVGCSKSAFKSPYENHKKVFEEFTKQLNLIGLKCHIRPGFMPYKLDEQKRNDVNYYYAVKHLTENVELRFSIFPRPKTSNNKIDETTGFFAFTLCVVENIAGKELSKGKKIDRIKDDIVKKVFNADIGYMAIVEPESNYGKGYKKAMIIGLLKKGVGYSYHTILFDEGKNDNINFGQLFYCVQFTDNK